MKIAAWIGFWILAIPSTLLMLALAHVIDLEPTASIWSAKAAIRAQLHDADVGFDNVEFHYLDARRRVSKKSYVCGELRQGSAAKRRFLWYDFDGKREAVIGGTGTRADTVIAAICRSN
jgi:hypothetical protein